MKKHLWILPVMFMLMLAACGGGTVNNASNNPNTPNSGSNGSNNPGTTSMAITTQPGSGVEATALSTQPVIELRDANGTAATADSSTVVKASIQVGSGTSGAVLSGTTSATASAGVVKFTDLKIDKPGSGYMLVFTATNYGTKASNAFNVTSVTSSGEITPSTPPTSDIYFSIDSQTSHAISRYIYGINSGGGQPSHLTLARAGGNRFTAWNWENNASNGGTDWLNENDTHMGTPADPPAIADTNMIDADRSINAASLVTVPILGYVAADAGDYNGLWPAGDVAQTPNYLQTRFFQSLPKKNAPFTTTPDTSDSYVYQDEFVNFLKQKYPGFATDPNKPIFFCLDNEPDLWGSTHPRLRGDTDPNKFCCGTGPTYDELLQKTEAFASAIKDVEPNALVFGAGNYGWNGYVSLQGASDSGTYGDFLNYYLKQLAAAESTYGRRLVDVLSVHWYPEASGNGTRIVFSNSTDPAVAAARVQAPRSLWDPTYTENSWIAQSIGGPIDLLPRLQNKIDTYYPGTKLAITEYNYGGDNDISGGIAQADVLGIFGRDQVFAAALWPINANPPFIFGGFDMFRNYDGANGSFGDTSIQATNTDVANASVYASVDAGNPNRMVIVCINKSGTAKTAGIDITHTVQFNTAEVYTLTSASSQPVRQSDLSITLTNAFQYTMPPNSVTTLVLKP
jgi:hypothetical protein